MRTRGWTCVFSLAALLACAALPANAATLFVAAGGDLQGALDAAQPGDTILLAEGAEFVGNFVLPVKTGTGWITVRTSAPDPVLPPAGVRIQPAHAQLLARLRSPNYSAALRTAAGAHHWVIAYLEFGANLSGAGDILQIGDGSNAQNTLSQVPHHIVLDHLYIHGDVNEGQKRGIALNAAHVTITDSYISECKAVGQDTQAIGGWNGPGPYVIENNYLEATGENFLLGGADPAIPNLVTDGVTFRRNYLSRPMSWRNPIIATPQGVTASAEGGGTLAAGVYAYRVFARRAVGQGTLGRSAPSAEVTVSAAAAGSAVRVRWQPVPGASEYLVSGRSPGTQNLFWSVTSPEFVDTGAAGNAPSVLPTPSLWSVKNLFELKSARNVVVEHNILENHWKESQPGYAIVLTPRNSNGACTWCVVEHVRFEYNLVRNVAAGVNLTGYDIPSRPTRQSNDIVFRHNVFSMNTSLGGNGWFMLIGEGPRDLVIEHNTIDSNGTTVVNVYGGTQQNWTEVYGFRMVANASRHGSYGINGSFFSYGNNILNNYFPGHLFIRNYLAGGPASRYPPDNLFAGTFPDQFVASASGDYTLSAGSLLRAAGPGGADIGADYAALMTRIEGVQSGVSPIGPVTLRPPTADFTATCTYLNCTLADGSAAGSAPVTGWSWTLGDGTQASGNQLSHGYAVAGTYNITLAVTDGNGLGAAVTKQVPVQAPVPPTAAFDLTCTYLECAFADASTAGSGGIATRSWSFGDQTGSTAASGVHPYSGAGTFTVALTVTDSFGLTSSASRTVAVAPPNVAPVAAFTASCVDLVCTFVDRSTDADGVVASWAWSIAGAAASGPAPTFAFAAPGTYTVTLAATDDDGATATTSMAVQVVAQVHATLVNGVTTRWDSRTLAGIYYWSADITLAVHGANERPIAGATVTASWSGGVTKTVSCVTNASGLCTFKSGTLSMLRYWVMLTVNNVAAPLGVYVSGANHGLTGNTAGTAARYVQP